MRLTCPACGERGADEFVYHGDATVVRPEADAPPDLWMRYVYLRDNPSGRHRELWYHAQGCHAWLVAERDLRTHEVFSVVMARDVASARRTEAA